MKIKITENKYVGDEEEPYIIAELGSNHNGDMDLAKKLILAAKESGAELREIPIVVEGHHIFED